MIKTFITIVIVLALFWTGQNIFRQVKQKEAEEKKAEEIARTGADASGLTGMAPHLAEALAAAQGQGAAGLKAFLQRYASQIQDPKLADIQLDYVLAAGRTDPTEAKRVFQAVKARVPVGSPVHARVKKLEGTFGN